MRTSRLDVLSSFFYNNADVRVRDKFLMGTPYTIVSFYLLYVVIITKVLPKFMENRKPLNYKLLMTILDVILCFRSFYFLAFSIYAWFFVYNWTCQPIDRSNSWEAFTAVEVSHQFVITKFIYTLQSVVFVVCKKQSPVGTYLLIHHASFPLILWVGVNYYPGGHATFVGLINSLVHFTVTSMRVYSAIYYDGVVPKLFKRIDVNMHILQFLASVIHSLAGTRSSCQVPNLLLWFQTFSAIYIAIIYNRFVLGSKKRRKIE